MRRTNQREAKLAKQKRESERESERGGEGREREGRERDTLQLMFCPLVNQPCLVT